MTILQLRRSVTRAGSMASALRASRHDSIVEAAQLERDRSRQIRDEFEDLYAAYPEHLTGPPVPETGYPDLWLWE